MAIVILSYASVCVCVCVCVHLCEIPGILHAVGISTILDTVLINHTYTVHVLA